MKSKELSENTQGNNVEEDALTPESALQKDEFKISADENYGYITDKENYLKRLRRIEGQTRGLQRMVEEEKYCIDILTQVSSATKSLQAVGLALLEDHLKHCVVNAAREEGEQVDVKIKEAMDAIARFLRS